MKFDKNNMTDKQLEKLRNEIVLGSLYQSDYENSFGIPANYVQAFFDGFCEYLADEMADHGFSDDEWWDVIDDFDTIEYLSDWYWCCEYPFGPDEEA